MFFFKKKSKRNRTEEQRVYQRIKPDDICLVEFRRRGKRDKKLAELSDISLTGIRFASIFHLRRQDQIRLYLYLPKKFPGQRKIKFNATVVRVTRSPKSDRYRIACALEHQEESTREVIRQFLFWQDTKPESPLQRPELDSGPLSS